MKAKVKQYTKTLDFEKENKRTSQAIYWKSNESKS